MRARDGQPGPTSRRDLDGVLITHQLGQRAARSSRQAAEVEAIIAVFDQMTAKPGDALGEICRRAIGLTSAGSVGISVLSEQTGEPMIRWKATAGVVGQNTFGVLPLDHSPCGVAMDSRLPELMTRPDRVFAQIAAAPFPVEETLVVPFFQGGRSTGTLWAISHDRRKQFDTEDVRQLKLLASLIPAALAPTPQRADGLPADAWINDMPQIVWTTRPDGVLAQISRAYYDYTGQTQTAAMPQWESTLAYDDLPMASGAWTTAVQTGRPYEIACRLRRAADGMMRWHLLSATPSRDKAGRIQFWLGTCTDFHDRAES